MFYLLLPSHERGSSLVEIIVGLALSAIMVLGLSKSTVQSLQSRTLNVRNAIAEEMAIEKLEELTAVNPSTLTSDNNEAEEIINGYSTYTRTISITEFDDESREVEVTVTTDNQTLGGNATVRATLIPWD